MRWMESQIETRQRLDKEMLEASYAELVISVIGPRNMPRFTPDNFEMADDAVCGCLRYLGVKPGNVPDSLTDFALRIDWLCRPSGTMHRNVRLEGDWYKHAFGAMLGKLDTGDPIAILPSTKGGYRFFDPSSGQRVRVNAKTAVHIEEDAVFFYRPLPQGELTLRDLAHFILDVFDRSDYIYILITALATTLVGLLPPWANQIVFGTVMPSGKASLIAPIGGLLLGVAISSTLFGICRNLMMARVSSKLDIATQAATFSRVLLLPSSFFKTYASGNLASRVSQVSALISLLTSIVLGSGLSFLLSAAYLMQIAVLAPPMVMPALLTTLLQALLTIIVIRISAKRQHEVMQASSELSGLVTLLLNGVNKIKLAGAEDRAFSKWSRQYARYAKASYNRPIIERALPALVTLVGMLGSITLFFVAGNSRMDVADYMSFSVAYGQVSAAVMMLANLAGQFAQVDPMLQMIEPVLKACPETSEDKPSVEKITGSIEVSNVSFRYDDKSPYVLDDLSFKVNSGEYVALVGRSGCGKSTIMRLLLGFEVPERGNIFYGPYDVGKVDLRSLRQSIGTVMQDGRLFMGDIASNITISNPLATLDDAWEAAEIAGIADDIRKMPMGMRTLISEGAGGVSGGQRQRLMIARAVCGNRRILMLDEATSALDNVTQKHVADSLEKLNCTRLVVAHRLSTVRHCDRIMVVDGGRIAEKGTYEELIAKNGIFAELVERQRLE